MKHCEIFLKVVLCINDIIYIKINKLRLVVTVIYQWPCVAKMTGVVAKMAGVFTGSLKEACYALLSYDNDKATTILDE